MLPSDSDKAVGPSSRMEKTLRSMSESHLSLPSGQSPTTWHGKQRSRSPDKVREEAWRRRKGSIKQRSSNRKSVTDEDLDELKACIELGFGFDSPDAEEDQRLSDTFPALELFYAVNKAVSKSANTTPLSAVTPASSTASDWDTPSPVTSPLPIFGPVKNSKTMKTRLRQWAQVVGCSVKQSNSKSDAQ